MVGDQFFDKVFDFVVGSRESFAFLCLEYNVLYGFYFGGRTGKTYLIEVGIDIVYTPFVKIEGPPAMSRREAEMMALASAWTLRHSSYRSPRGTFMASREQ